MQFFMDPQQQQHQQQHHPPPPPQAAAQPTPPPPQGPPVQLMFQQPPLQVAPPPLPPPLQQQPQLLFPPSLQQQQVPVSGVGGFPSAPAPAGLGHAQIPQFTQVPANPTPNLVSVPVGNHPPYAEMITEAIRNLKEKDGSSKRAINGYIERAYANSLSANHSVLLTTHLKRLKEQGHIVMVKHSYMLPDPNNAVPLPVRSPHLNPSQPSNPVSNGPKRRGRPPKAKTPIPESSVPPLPTSVQPAMVDPATILPASVTVTNPGPNTDPASVFVSLGLVDGPIHVPVTVADPSPAPRKRGRPRKTEAFGAPAPLQVNATLAKKSTARPRKVAAKNAANAVAAGSIAVNPPPKVQLPKLKKDGTPMKPRGRPPRKNVADAGVPVPVPVSGATGAAIAPAVYVGEGALTVAPAAGPAPGAKRRGRPPTKGLKVQKGPKKARKSSGKPVGRPRKFPLQAGVVPYDEMKKKLELYQLKIKQSVSVLKPCVEGNANAAGALDALKELEELANGGSEAPATAAVPVQQQPPPVQN